MAELHSSKFGLMESALYHSITVNVQTSIVRAWSTYLCNGDIF